MAKKQPTEDRNLTIKRNCVCDVCEKTADCVVLNWANLCPECHEREEFYEAEPPLSEGDWTKLTPIEVEDYHALLVLAAQIDYLDKLKRDRSTHLQSLTETLAIANEGKPVGNLTELTEEIAMLEEQVNATFATVKQQWIYWKQSKGEYKGMTPEEHANWHIGVAEIFAWAGETYRLAAPWEHIGKEAYEEIQAAHAQREDDRKQSNTKRMRKMRAADRRRRKDTERKRVSRAAAKEAKQAKEDERRYCQVNGHSAIIPE